MKISIITINYNNADGLERTINSVLGQSYNCIEYIVIDGGSEDSSKQVLDQYKDKLAYSVSEPDLGVYNAMNKGILASTGEYLLFLNSGDILAEKTVIDQVLKASLDKDLVSAGLIVIKDGVRRNWIPEDTVTFGLFYQSSLPHPSTFISRGLFKEVGLYDESLNIVSDWKFFLIAVCKYNCSYKSVDVLVSEFMEDGLSSDPKNLEKIERERNSVLKDNFAAFLGEYEELMLARRQLRKLRYTIKIKKILGLR